MGTEIDIHAFMETVFMYGWDPGRVALLMDARNAFNEVYRRKILDAVVIHAPGIARYVHMFYGCAPWLIAGQNLIISLQGTQQGDTLGLYLFSLVTQHMIGDLQADCKIDLNIWCADAWTLIVKIPDLFKIKTIFQATGITVGYHLEVGKSKVWWPTADQNKLWRPRVTPDDDHVMLKPLPFQFLAEEATPEILRLVPRIKLLGAPIGIDEFVAFFLSERMIRIDELLSAVQLLKLRRWVTRTFRQRCTECAHRLYRSYKYSV